MGHWIKQGLELVGKTVKLMPLEEKHFEALVAGAKDSRIWEHYRRDYGNDTFLYEALHQALILRDQGVNPECKLMLLDCAFEILSVRRVTIQTDATNTRSRRLLFTVNSSNFRVLLYYGS